MAAECAKGFNVGFNSCPPLWIACRVDQASNPAAPCCTAIKENQIFLLRDDAPVSSFVSVIRCDWAVISITAASDTTPGAGRIKGSGTAPLASKLSCPASEVSRELLSICVEAETETGFDDCTGRLET